MEDKEVIELKQDQKENGKELGSKYTKRKGKSNPYSWHNVTIYMSNRVLKIVDWYKQENNTDKFPYKEIFEKGLAQEFSDKWKEFAKKDKEIKEKK